MVTYKKMTYDGSKVQVESAIRDEEGYNIKDYYAKKTDINDATISIKNSGGSNIGVFSVNQPDDQNITLPMGTVQLLNQSVTFDTYTPTQKEIDDGTYPEFPYKASVSVTGVTASTYAIVTYSEEQATSLNFATYCDTATDVIYLYARTNPTPNPNDTITIPTISIGMDYSDITIDSVPTSGSGNAVSSGGVYTALGTKADTSTLSNYVDKTTNQSISGQKTFTNTPTIRDSFPQLYLDNTSDDYTTTYTDVDTKFYVALRDTNQSVVAHISNYVYDGGRGLSISSFDKSGGSVKEANIGLVVPKSYPPYVTATYRAYNSANVNDVLTIGNVPSMFASMMYSLRFWNTNATHSGGTWDGFAFIYTTNNAPSSVLTLNGNDGARTSFTIKKKCLVIGHCQLTGAGSNSFGVSLVAGSARTQDVVGNPANSKVTQMLIVPANSNVSWQIYGTFSGPQNYNEICSAQFIIIPLE